MKRNILYIIVISLFLWITYSCDKEDISGVQSESFVKYYTNFPEFKAADVVSLSSGYALLGTALTADSGYQICLIRTDKFGNSVKFEKLYGRIKTDKAYCLKAMNDGGFTILGSSQNPSTNKLEVYVIRTNSEGSVIWTRIIQETGDVEAKYCEVNSNGSVYMAGYTISTTKAKEIWWFAIDQFGSDLWLTPNKFGYDWDDEATYLELLASGDLLITGYTSNGTVNNAYLLKTDSEGSPDAFFPLVSTHREEGSSIKALNDDSYLLLTTVYNGTLSDISLKLIDYTHLSVDWEMTYQTNENDYSKGLISDGSSIYILSTKSIAGVNSAISITSTDMSGIQFDVSSFGRTTGLTAASFKQTLDGGFIIVGTNTNAEENNTSLALIKTNADIGM